MIKILDISRLVISDKNFALSFAGCAPKAEPAAADGKVYAAKGMKKIMKSHGASGAKAK